VTKKQEVALPPVSAWMPVVYLGIPLVLATACCCIFLLVFGAKLNFINLLSSQQGQAIKGAGKTEGKWDASVILLMSVLWWAQLRMGQLSVKGAAKALLYFLFLVSLGVNVLTCVATVDRTNLMPLLAGVFLIFLYRRSRVRNVKLSSIALIGLGSTTSIVLFFLFLSFLRGASALRVLGMTLLGYTVTSYNHLAALLHGVLHYAYEGSGVYIARFLVTDNKIVDLFGFHQLFNWPSGFVLGLSEFSSTASAGLNPGFIWSGTFGYLYSDVGWWTPLLIFAAGAAAAYLWAGFTAGRTIASLLYLWVAFWVLFWLGWNVLLDGRIVTILETGIALSLYDKAFIRRVIRSNSDHHEPAFISGIEGPRMLPGQRSVISGTSS
jgi:hypothetical protein